LTPHAGTTFGTRVPPQAVRAVCLLTGRASLERLHCFPSFPVYIGCTDADPETDRRADMVFDICRETGFIQLAELMPLNLVYGAYHSEALGPLWQRHHKAFSRFVADFRPREVLEIGGSNAVVAGGVLELLPDCRWIIVEPSPSVPSDGRLRLRRGYFDASFSADAPLDAIVHSHVLEHLYDPVAAIHRMHSLLPEHGRLIFSVPDMRGWLERKLPNTLNFEHTVFLVDAYIERLLAQAGFSILERVPFEDHSLFYAAERTEPKPAVRFDNLYEEHAALFTNFLQHYRESARELNQRIENFPGAVYLFGAHIFSQMYLEMGLRADRIAAILDNSIIKQGKRLYGSALHVASPMMLAGIRRPAVIVRAGAYTGEIVEQIRAIQPGAEIW